MKIQPRIADTVRKRSEARLLEEIADTIANIAAMYNCSKSFVIATLLADALGIKEQARYYNATHERAKRKALKNRGSSKIKGIGPRARHVAKDTRHRATIH